MSKPSDSPKQDPENQKQSLGRLIKLLAADDLEAERLWRGLRPEIASLNPEKAKQIGRCISSLNYGEAIRLVKSLND